MTTPSFLPPPPLRNPHLQTILASTRPRRLLVATWAKPLLQASREVVLDCGEGVRLLGAWAGGRGGDQGLVVLIHGWEGSSNSSYLLSAAARLFAAGFSVLRLNLRDHGDSHALNRQLFNSTRLAEVIGAIRAITLAKKPRHTFLAGFSLGGNFVLRLGLAAEARGVRLTAIAAVCPLIDPARATARLEARLPLYHRYFVRKWQRSLRKKFALFPNPEDAQALLRCHSLSAMHEHFVPRHTPYDTAAAYFSAYSLSGAALTAMAVPCRIIAAEDDPITSVDDLETIEPSPAISLQRTRHGGHCGFLKDYALHSWIDDELPRFFSSFVS